MISRLPRALITIVVITGAAFALGLLWKACTTPPRGTPEVILRAICILVAGLQLVPCSGVYFLLRPAGARSRLEALWMLASAPVLIVGGLLLI